jgi:hypothetical protein
VAFAGQIKRIVRDENNQPDYFVTFLTYEEEGEVRLSRDKVREGPLSDDKPINLKPLVRSLSK